jgi:hypothetical protein
LNITNTCPKKYLTNPKNSKNWKNNKIPSSI